jgi:diaminohydroxyphosphoribosylaminopyrimidine deaminase/5-amino-6-(5-phosphoribosylamino)uracil reductase
MTLARSVPERGLCEADLSAEEGSEPSSNPTKAPDPVDVDRMRRALELAASVRTTTSPNPWVGSLVVSGESRFEGATRPPGGAHAEVVALAAAGDRARGATLYTTLEPCAHQGRTPPCVGAVSDAGISRVVVALLDPDPKVRGRGVEQLRKCGVQVDVGVCAEEAETLLAPYLKHRRTGLPWVVLKLACTMDGRIAAPDGSSQWITGPQAREDAQRLRAESDAVLVGAGTVSADDPRLTVRLGGNLETRRQPLRVVLGRVPPGARIESPQEMSGELGQVLSDLGGRGVLQLLVEGGARVAHSFHESGLVDRYVFYFAPALSGGDDAQAMFAGPGAGQLDTFWRGSILSVKRLGDDLRVELAPGHGAQEAHEVREVHEVHG